MEANSNDSRTLKQSLLPKSLVVIPGVVLLLQLLFSIFSQPGLLNHDCAFILHGAQLILDGQHPIRDFVDLAPPLVFYSVVPIALAAKLFGASVGSVWTIFSFLTICAAYIIASMLVIKDSDKLPTRDFLMLGPLLMGSLLWQLAATYHLGQREYFFSIFFFLLFIVRWKRSQKQEISRFSSMVAGITTGFLCFVKPHFLLIVGAVEMYWLARSLFLKEKPRSLLAAPEILSFALTLVVCLLLTLSIPSVGNYFLQIIPLVAAGYGAFDVSKSVLFSFAAIHGQLVGNRVLVVVFVLLGMVLIRRTSLLAPLLVWTVSAMVVYAIQGKGWAYHALPMVTGYFLVSVVALSSLLTLLIGFLFKSHGNALTSKASNCGRTFDDRLVGGYERARYRIATITLLLTGVLSIPISPGLIHESVVSHKAFPFLNDAIAAETKIGDPVLILTTNFIAAFPALVELDRRQATRYLWCFSIPMLDKLNKLSRWSIESKSAKWEAVRKDFTAEVLTDIGDRKPTVIAVDIWHYDLLNCILSDSKINDELARSYEPLRRSNGFAIWKRKANLNQQVSREVQAL